MKTKSFKHYHLLLLFCLAFTALQAQDVTVTVNAALNKKAVSPYIYGANNWFDKPAQFYKDAGLRMARTNGGNNATKYNWRKKISSHPDWYNNVYPNDWDAMSKKAAANNPNMQVMWAFQLLGRVASNTSHNFNDWAYNQSQYWQGVGQNLAGGGTPNTADPGGKALVEGDINLYTEAWPADSTVEILNHWFGPKGIGLNKNQFVYWNMDNECDVWNGTHDDVMPKLLPAAEFMDRFISVAKKARALFPGIKICGPVTTSEWQWFKWGDESIRIDGKYYSWLEYFIKRCADEEKASGVRVIDVVDLHNYPWAKNGDVDALQLHRMYFDTNYDYPGANGLHTINGGWDTNLNKEYIFKRINDWLTKYFGANHGITLSISEWASSGSNPNVCSVAYGSVLGTFANNGVELFTPWSWDIGMWETLHLYSRYSKKFSVSSTSTLENTVSAYTTVNEAADSMTVIIVNRDMNASRNVTVNLNGFAANSGSSTTLQLAALPATETFKSHSSNALKAGTVAVSSNSFSITVPKLSTTAVILKSTTTGIQEHENLMDKINIFPNPANNQLKITINRSQGNSAAFYDGESFILLNSYGQTVAIENLQPGIYDYTINTSHIPAGLYVIKFGNEAKRLIIQH